MRPHVIFLVDYDMDIAEHLVHGVDVWINTPRRPWEASGTSGMKVLVNGGLNLSELDGWWAEAYAPEVGWALGDGLEHDSDPAWDAAEAERLYDLLENEIIPEFYDRDEQGIPRRWIARVRESMARLAPEFSTNRMMEDYLDRYYLPGAAAYRRAECAGRPAPGGCTAGLARHCSRHIEDWRRLLDEHWREISFVDYRSTGKHRCDARTVSGAGAGSVPPDAIRSSSTPNRWRRAGRLPSGSGRQATGHAEITVVAVTARTAKAPRAIGAPTRCRWPARGRRATTRPAWCPGIRTRTVPLEASHILWYR